VEDGKLKPNLDLIYLISKSIGIIEKYIVHKGEKVAHGKKEKINRETPLFVLSFGKMNVKIVQFGLYVHVRPYMPEV
jgi:hypothetical protein